MSEDCLCKNPSYRQDVLIPQVGVIRKITQETPDVRSFIVTAPGGGRLFDQMPGQCAMICAPGIGEAMFSITSSPTETDYHEFSIKECGELTSYLHGLKEGDQILVRGPYGNHFPVDDIYKGKDLLFIAGGIGLAPLRSVINYCLAKREDYGKIDILYGSRSKADLGSLGEGSGHQSLADHRPRGPGVGRTCGICSQLSHRSRFLDRQDRHHLRSAHHDQVLSAESGTARIQQRPGIYHTGTAYEMRDRQMRKM